jgi:serine/threonine-protein kinase
MEDLTGKQLGPYQVIEPLGEGGMAGVFKAFQPGVMRNVALKVLPRYYANDPEFVGRFRQEAKILANLQHPHILPVFDYGEADGYTYIAMPFLQNGDLTRLLKGQPLPLPQVRRIISQLGDALDYAHQQGLVHRDVKPNNVLLDERGNCLLSDFGITKIIEGTSKFTVTGGIIGTPDYMSPEQGMGRKLDGRSDIYALGIMLYQMVTGRVPYKADTPMAVLFKHVTDPLPMPRKLNPALPEAVEQVVLKALAKQPEDRFATAGEMVQAIQRAIPETTPTAPASAPEAPPPPPVIPPRPNPVAPITPPPAPLPHTPPPPHTNFSLMGVAGLLAISVVAFLCAVAGFVIWTGRPTPPIDTASATNTVAPAASTAPAAAATPVLVVVSTSASLPTPTNSPVPPTVAVTAVRSESISLPTFTASPSPSPTPTLVPSDTPSATPPATFSPTPSPTVPPTATPSPLPPVQLGQNCSRAPAASLPRPGPPIAPNWAARSARCR